MGRHEDVGASRKSRRAAEGEVTIGTKSVLFGAHAFWLHPWFVAWAWWRLFGFPWDPRLWVAFFVHDLGYVGKRNMDGPEGERHPEFGGDLMSWFDLPRQVWFLWRLDDLDSATIRATFSDLFRWEDLALYHSRFYAKRDHRPPSRLCAADKLALSLTPGWLYLPMASATGELAEYRQHHEDAKSGKGKYAGDKHTRPDVAQTDAEWFARVQDYCARWAWAHRDGGADTWTGGARVEHA